jgi:tetratricopeptide (TPR) repeat protein
MLRDFCKRIGLSIEAYDYQFPLEFSLLKNNELTESQLIFNCENILGFFPVLKEYTLPSEVLKPTFLEAENFFNQGHLQSASEKYKQVIILCHEICGSIHNFSAIAHKKLAYIGFYEGNYQNAINLIKKSIIIYEKLSEFDSILVASCYSELGSYYSSIGDLLNAFKAMYKAWEITSMIYPKNVSDSYFFIFLYIFIYFYIFFNDKHPEIASKILVLSYFFVDIDCISNALELLEQSIKINSLYYEENSQKMSKLFLLASQLYLRNYNIKDAIVYYEKYTNVIKSIYKDEKIIESTEKILEGFKQASDELKKKNTFVKGKENTKKIFEELIGKFVNKSGFDERIGSKMFLDQNDIQLYEYMVKNGYVKPVDEKKN